MFLAENDPRRAAGLVWLDEALAQQAATHALIIGVGAYQSPRFKKALTSTTVSARAVADFFIDKVKASFRNPGVPLGSVALLLSEPASGSGGLASYGNGPVLRATFANASAAVAAWADRMDSSPDNFAFLYVAGHGEGNQGKTAFLLEDCFLDRNRATYGMVEVEQFAGALENTTPTKQLLLFDCCRTPTGMKLPWGEQFGDKLISRSRDEDDHGRARLQKVISATLPDKVALGNPGDTTLFAGALLTALDGVASDTSFRSLPVRAGNLSDKVNDLLALHRRPDEERQVTDVDGAGTFDITVPAPRQTVPVFLSLADPASWPQSVMTVTPSVGAVLTLSGIDGAPPFHRIDLPRRIDVAVKAEAGGNVLGTAQAEVGAPALFLKFPDDADGSSSVVGQLPPGRSALPMARIEIDVRSPFLVDAGAIVTIRRSDEPDNKPKQISVKLGALTPVDVRPGSYDIVLWTPDKKVLTRTVEVAEDKILRVSFETEVSPHEWLAGAAATGVIRRGPPLPAGAPHADAAPAAAAPLQFSVAGHVGFDLAPDAGTPPELQLVCHQDDGRLARIDVEDERGKRFMLDIAEPITRPFFARIVCGPRRQLVAIPAVGSIARKTGGGWNPYLVVDRAAPDRASLTKVVVEDTRWMSLLGFLGARSFDMADKLLDAGLKEKFHTSLDGYDDPAAAIENKVRNPLAAAAGALIAVAASRSDIKERWDPSLYNLANWFPNLADGPVILGRRLLMQARSAAAIAEARAWFFKGFDRGVPVYALAVDWLARGLESLPGDDPELRRRRLLARGLASRVDSSQAFTVISLSNDVTAHAPPNLSARSGFSMALQPASDGDAIILRWGDAAAPHHALVDLGRSRDYRALKPQLAQIRDLDLFAVSHIDADHIEGAVPLFKDAPPPFQAKRIWFNAHAQLEAANGRLPAAAREIQSPGQAEKVTAGILKSGWPWNGGFASGVVSVDSPEAALPILLDGGLSLTLLSPSDRKLAQLLPNWNAELARAGLRTADPDEVAKALADGREQLGGSLNIDALAGKPFAADATTANGASIAFVAEFGGKRVLLAADAHPDILVASLRALGASEANPYRLDCLKVSHHGSKANTSPELLKIIDCTRFAFSTDGSRHGHPDPETIARILKNDPARQKTLIFNFRQPATEIWDDAELKRRWHYDCVFPAAGTSGIEFDI